MRALGVVGLCFVLVGCSDSAPPLVYQAVPVERRDIVISALAAGVVEPDVTVEVKSKASGEILEMEVATGDRVERGALLVRIDQRQPRNQLEEAEADLDVARARLKIAEAGRGRSEKLLAAQAAAETGHEQAVLDHANARAEVVRARVAVENGRIRLDDTEVLAPINGKVVEVNDALEEHPEWVNEDPYGRGWIIEIAPTDPTELESLLSSDDYEAHVKARSAQ